MQSRRVVFGDAVILLRASRESERNVNNVAVSVGQVLAAQIPLVRENLSAGSNSYGKRMDIKKNIDSQRQYT